jgi:hypothetical protein
MQYFTGLKKAHDVFPIAGLMLGGAVVGFLFHLASLMLTAPAKMASEAETQVRELENEIVAQNKKEEEHRNLVRRRAAAPFLKPVDDDWVRLPIKDGPGKIMMLHHGSPAVLCGSLPEIKELPDGELVYFPVENHGQAAPAVSLSLDGERIRLQQEAEMSGAHGYYFFTYPYAKAKHGQKQMLTLSFETNDGQHDTNKYMMVHGHRILTRIDPPLPSSSNLA